MLAAGERLLVVAEDRALLEAISTALWEADPASFLANGLAGGAHDARQPVLLSDRLEAANGARYVLLADGRWRDPGDGFTRAILLFDEATVTAARATWKALGDRAGLERRYFRQEGGRWVKVA